MERTERFYKIDLLLRDNRYVTLDRFLDELSVSKATFKRDLEYMRDRLNAPIIWDREMRAYSLSQTEPNMPTYELPGIWFNQSEILALLSMETLLSEIQPGLLGSRLNPLKEKLNDLIELGEYSVDTIKDRIKILNMASRSRAIKHFDTISLSLLRRSKLSITYYVRTREELTERDISPQRLVFYRDNWYLDAWCHTAESVRSFSLDAVRSANVMDDPAIEIDHAQLDSILGAGYGIFSGQEILWAKLRFNRERAKWVTLEQWHPDQKGYIEKNGEYVLELPYSQVHELVMDILKYGSDVEVLEPASLRSIIQKKLDEAIKIYSN